VLLDELAQAGKLPQRMVTATRGNHGQSVPFAAVPRGVAVSVFAPKGNSVEKNAAMVGWGAELIEFGSDYDEARLEAVRYAKSEGGVYVPPFHPALVRGVATYALELFTAVADLDVVYVPGAWELPLAARGAARDGYDAIVALGCVIRGETAHFDHVGRAATDGLARVQLDSEVPVGLGVLTPDTLEQALARAGGELGNAGTEAARAALRMADLQRQLGW